MDNPTGPGAEVNDEHDEPIDVDGECSDRPAPLEPHAPMEESQVGAGGASWFDSTAFFKGSFRLSEPTDSLDYRAVAWFRQVRGSRLRRLLFFGKSKNPMDVPARSPSNDEDRWLHNTGSWIPKKYREPWLHDILEDREAWRAAGWSWKRIELHTVVQFINAMILNPRTWFAALFSWVASKFWPCQ